MTENTAKTAELLARIDELESRFAFMESTIDTLNDEIIRQSKQISLAENTLRQLSKQLEQLNRNNDGIRPLEEEVPPPHY